MNIWTELERHFSENAGRPSLTDNNGVRVTYLELLQRAKGIAALIRSSAAPGSRVCILHSHSWFDALGVLGTLAADCVVVPMSLNYGETNCCQIVNRSQPALLLTDLDPLPESIAAAALDNKVRVMSAKGTSGNFAGEAAATSSDVAMIMFTSGTTGVPKGAMLSHGNILANLADIAAYFAVTQEDHILIARPLYHGAVMTGEFLHGLMHGSGITFYTEAFSPRRLLAFLAEKGCTTMCATPTLFYHLAMNKRSVNLPELKNVVVSGECLNPQVAEKILSSFPGIKFFNVYGLTEASPRVCHLDPEFFRAKIGSVGVPLNSVSIRVVDEGGRDVSRGSIGELYVQGPNVMLGYWKDEGLTSQKIVDGWLHTGDMCRQDEDGFLYIIGRKDHMIIRAGVNIYPQDIENSLLKDGAFKEVMVWGETDANYGQRICAAFVPGSEAPLSTADVMGICKKWLDAYKWPDEVLIVENLPRNASGKVMRLRPPSRRGRVGMYGDTCMKSKVLETIVPPITGLVDEAYPLVVALAHERPWPWFYSNYIQMVFKNDDQMGYNVRFYKTDHRGIMWDTLNPWINYNIVNVNFLKALDMGIIDLIVRSIRQRVLYDGLSRPLLHTRYPQLPEIAHDP